MKLTPDDNLLPNYTGQNLQAIQLEDGSTAFIQTQMTQEEYTDHSQGLFHLLTNHNVGFITADQKQGWFYNS